MIENIVITIFIILFCLMQVYLIHLYFSSFIEKKVSNMTFLIETICMMGLIKLLPTNTNMIVKAGVFIFLLSIIVFTAFGGNKVQKMYHTVYFSLIMLLSDLCLSLVVVNFTAFFNSYEGSFFMTIVYFSFNFLSLLLSYIIVKLLLHFNVEVNLNLNNKEYFLLGVIPFCSLLCILGIDKFKTLSLLECYMFLLIVNVCIMLIYFKILRKNLIAQNYLVIKKENEYYQSCLSNQKEIAQLNHDLRNILLNLDMYLEKGKVKEARSQISEMIKTSYGANNKISGCIPIDAILNNKIATCEGKKIRYKIDIQFPHDVYINSIDIAAILGNLLDNAIEANLRLDDIEKRNIIISIKYDNDKLVFKITNSCKPININLAQDLFSSEKVIGRYGIGLNSVKDRINKLGGYCDFSYKDFQFYSFVVVPLTNL